MLKPQRGRYRFNLMLGMCDIEWILHTLLLDRVAKVIERSYVVSSALSATSINTKIHANMIMMPLVVSFQRRYVSVKIHKWIS